jgi:hypothetical protein
MTDTPQIVEAKIRAGYRPPTENPLVCRNCGASGYNPTPFRHRYFCKRHQFYVHSRGYCPFFSTEKYVPQDAPKPKPSPYKQPELF